MSIFDTMGYGISSKTYSLTLLKDGKCIKSKVYTCRSAAESAMYKLLEKKGIYVRKVWDDKHDKTYLCADGYEFHINRSF